MRDDLTVIYYTSNRENPEFEEKIKKALLENIGSLPLISVSQKPIDFGENICVGDVGVSEINCRRQFLMGCEAAKTKYVCAAESDFLYQKEYFEIVPEKDNVLYLVNPTYVLYSQRRRKKIYYRKKWGSEGAMVANREHLVNRLSYILKDAPMWHDKNGNDRIIPQLLRSSAFKRYHIDNPIITFKTDYQLHRKTPVAKNTSTRELPYWGSSQKVIEEYLCAR